MWGYESVVRRYKMKRFVLLIMAGLLGWVGVSWAGAPVPEIPSGAAPVVLSGVAALVFWIRSYLHK